MSLADHFRPAWNRSDPAKRLKAVEDLARSRHEDARKKLIRIALRTRFGDVRNAVVRHLDSRELTILGRSVEGARALELARSLAESADTPSAIETVVLWFEQGMKAWNADLELEWVAFSTRHAAATVYIASSCELVRWLVDHGMTDRAVQHLEREVESGPSWVRKSARKQLEELRPGGSRTHVDQRPGSVADRVSVEDFLRSAEGGDHQAVRAAVAAGVDPNAPGPGGNTALHMASNNGHAAVVQELLGAGADANVANDAAVTPLHLASEAGFATMAATLLERGADVEVRNTQGVAPVYIAAQMGHARTVEILLEHGADANGSGVVGLTPIFVAIEHGRRDVVSMLLEHGVDPNVVANGATPLIFAANFGRLEIARDLLAAGARKDVDYRGMTPAVVARKSGFDHLARLLEGHVAG